MRSRPPFISGGHDPLPQLPQLVFGVFIIVCIEFNLFIICVGLVITIGVCLGLADLVVNINFIFIKGIVVNFITIEYNKILYQQQLAGSTAIIP